MVKYRLPFYFMGYLRPIMSIKLLTDTPYKLVKHNVSVPQLGIK